MHVLFSIGWLQFLCLMWTLCACQKWAYTPLNAAGSQSFTGVLGMDFDVNSPILVYQVGCFNNNRTLVSPIWVGLFNRSSQLLVPGTSVNLTGSNTRKIGFIAASQLPAAVALPAGNYTVAAIGYSSTFQVFNGQGSAGSFTDGVDSCPFSPGADLVSFVGASRFIAAASLTFPTTLDGGPAARYGAATFSFLSAACPQTWMTAQLATSPPNVSSWPSLSSSLSLADQSGGIQYKNNWINHNPALRFPGDENSLMTGNLASALTLAPTIIAVSKIYSQGTGCCAGVFASSPSGSYGLSLINGSMTLDGLSGASCASSQNITNVWALTTAQYSTQLSLVGATLALNGASQSVNCTPSTSVANPNSTVSIGGRPGTGVQLVREVAESLLFVTAFLTSQVRTSMESYLAVKYGLTKSGVYTSSSGSIIYSSLFPYVHNIFGIGCDAKSLLDQRVSSSEVETQQTLVMASSPDFSSSNSDPSRNSLQNGQFVICGADDGVLQFTSQWPRLNRSWRCEVTGTVPTLFIGIDAAAISFPGGNAQVPVMLLSANSKFLTNEAAIFPLTGFVQKSGVTILLPQNGTALNISRVLPGQSAFYVSFADVRLLSRSLTSQSSSTTSRSLGMSTSRSESGSFTLSLITASHVTRSDRQFTISRTDFWSQSEQGSGSFPASSTLIGRKPTPSRSCLQQTVSRSATPSRKRQLSRTRTLQILRHRRNSTTMSQTKSQLRAAVLLSQNVSVEGNVLCSGSPQWIVIDLRYASLVSQQINVSRCLWTIVRSDFASEVSSLDELFKNASVVLISSQLLKLPLPSTVTINFQKFQLQIFGNESCFDRLPQMLKINVSETRSCGVSPVASTPAVNTAKTVSSTAQAVTIGALDPMIAAQAARAGLSLLLIVCEVQDGPLGFYNSPIPLSIGHSGAEYFVGAAFGNVLLLCVFGAAQLAIAFFLHRARGRDWNSALAFVRFPSLLVFPIMFLQQASVSAGVTTVMFAEPAFWIFGAAAVAAFTALLPLTFLFVLRPSVFYCRFEDDSRRTGGVLTYLFYGKSRWVDIPDAAPSHRAFKQRYQFFFSDYRPHGRYFILAEMSMNVFCGIAQGMISPRYCKSLLFACTVAYGSFALAGLYVRPFNSLFYGLFSVGQSLAQLISCVMSMAAVVSDNSSWLDNAAYANSACMYLLFLQVVVGLWPRAHKIRQYCDQLQTKPSVQVFSEASVPLLAPPLSQEMDEMTVAPVAPTPTSSFADPPQQVSQTDEEMLEEMMRAAPSVVAEFVEDPPSHIGYFTELADAEYSPLITVTLTSESLQRTSDDESDELSVDIGQTQSGERDTKDEFSL